MISLSFEFLLTFLVIVLSGCQNSLQPDNPPELPRPKTENIVTEAVQASDTEMVQTSDRAIFRPWVFVTILPLLMLGVKRNG